MRIAVWHNLPSGGGKRALVDHVKFLVESGHHVESWCPPSADQDFLPLSDYVQEHVRCLRPTVASKAMTVRELMRDRVDAIEAMKEHSFVCAEEMGSADFDVIFANSCMYFRAPPIGRMTTLPSVLYLQEPYRWLYEAMPNPPWAAEMRSEHWWKNPADFWEVIGQSVVTRRRRVQIREEVSNAKSFDRVLCNSSFSRESILRAYGLDANVCYLGVDDVHFTSSTRAREDFFLTVGAVMAEKNVEFIIRALAEGGIRRWPLVWIANVVNDTLRVDMNRLAESLGVSLEIRTRVSDVELLDLFQRAGLFLYAPRLEPFGLAPLEAAATGLPTVAVAEAGPRETVIDGLTGRVTQPDPRAFISAVDDLVGDVSKRVRLGDEARRAVETNWRLSDAGRRLEAELLDAVSRREK
jgi:glycosyltransferase involved in cell wall biosynthesis